MALAGDAGSGRTYIFPPLSFPCFSLFMLYSAWSARPYTLPDLKSWNSGFPKGGEDLAREEEALGAIITARRKEVHCRLLMAKHDKALICFISVNVLNHLQNFD
jgi:hypothetical protein